jgi:hypothetical protein
MLNVVLAGAAGAALVYFLDPSKGRHRVAAARERLTGLLAAGGAGRSPARAASPSRRAGALEVQAIARRPVGASTEDRAARRDAALAARVEASLRGDPDVPPGQITIRAENGRIVLRGRVDHAEQIEVLIEKVEAMPGVRGVENRLHLAQATGRLD